MVNELFKAIAENNLASFRELLASYPSLADARSGHGVSAILFAIYHGRPECARELVKAGAPVGIHEAAALGDLALVRKMVEADPGIVNAYSDDGFQPLGLASYFGNPEVASYLLENGADPDSPSRNAQRVAPIHSAAASGISQLVSELIVKGADVNARQQGGYTALHAAIQNRDLNTIRILVENGADCGAENDSGQTPKDFAQKDNVEEVHRILRSCT